MESFSIMGVHWKIWNQYTGREIGLKGGGAWTVFRFKTGLDKKRGSGIFEGKGGGSYGIVSLTLKTSPNTVGDILWRCF